MSYSEAVIQRSGHTAIAVLQRSGLTAIAVFVIALALTACTIAPQRPSQRSDETPVPDSALMMQVEAHRMLAQAADAQLVEYIRLHPGHWFAQEDGSWVLDPNPDPFPHRAREIGEQSVALHMVVKDLQGNLLLDEQKEYRLGHCELPEAVENTLHSTLSTLNLIILAPYYVAFGSQGTDAIPPYTNVIIEIELL